MFDNDSDFTSGAFVDPGVIMGPRAGALSHARQAVDESSDTLALPIGGAQGSPTIRPTPAHFFHSPVGWLVILLGLGYIVFHQVFGPGVDIEA